MSVRLEAYVGKMTLVGGFFPIVLFLTIVQLTLTGWNHQTSNPFPTIVSELAHI